VNKKIDYSTILLVINDNLNMYTAIIK